jgi:hypothetical protein
VLRCVQGGVPTNHLGEVVAPKDGNPDAVVPGLMAAGEAACASVHGANRLGANSLLDIVVFGRAVANRTKEILKPGTPHKSLPADAGESSVANFDKVCAVLCRLPCLALSCLALPCLALPRLASALRCLCPPMAAHCTVCVCVV